MFADRKPISQSSFFRHFNSFSLQMEGLWKNLILKEIFRRVVYVCLGKKVERK